MTLLEIAKHALEAMEDAMYRADTHEFYDAKESLRCAIEQAEQVEQEPVAWYCNEGHNRGVSLKQESPEWTPLYTAPTPRKPEPSAVKHMMRWVEHLKRLSDDGQHMNIPGLSSGACWELAVELERFIKEQEHE